MSTAIALRSDQSRCDVPSDLAELHSLCLTLAEAGIIPEAHRGKPANIMAIALAARALDMPLWTALDGIDVIKGKTFFGGEISRALILRAGHSYTIDELTDQRCTMTITRRDTGVCEPFTWTSEDSKRAGLTGGNHTANPKAMMLARCSTFVARMYCPDVVAGMAYERDELEATAPPRAVRKQHPVLDAEVEPTWSPEQITAADVVAGRAEDATPAELRALWRENTALLACPTKTGESLGSVLTMLLKADAA